MTMRADTQTITLPVSAEEAFAFLAEPENLPRWAVGFARGIRREGDTWIVQTAQGGDAGPRRRRCGAKYD